MSKRSGTVEKASEAAHFSYLGVYNYTRIYEDDCRAPSEVETTTDHDDLDVIPPGQVMVAAAHIISVKTPNFVKGFRPMTPCTHVKQRFSAGSKGIVLRLEYDYETSFQDTGSGSCRRSTYTETQREIAVASYSISLEELSSLGLLGIITTNYPDSEDEIPGADIKVTDIFWDQAIPGQLEKKLVGLRDAAMRTMIPKLDVGYSAIVLIIELIEMRFLYKQLLAWIAKSTRLWTRLLREGLPAVRRSLSTRRRSADFLALEFGLMPILGEIKAFAERFNSAAEDVDKFLDEAGEPLTFHYQKALSPESFHDESFYDADLSPIAKFGYGGADFGTHFAGLDFQLDCIFKTKKEAKLKYHATLRFQYDVEAPMSAISRFKAELDHYGLNFSISDFWEVVPLSFVADWFFNIGGYLSRFDKTNLPIKVTLFDFCDSVKVEYKEETSIDDIECTSTGITQTGDHESWSLFPGQAPLIREHHVYRRWTPFVKVPKDGSGLTLRTPRGFQVVLGAALIGSRYGK